MTSGETVLYFAYGSNMDPEQMRERCPGADAAGQAALPGYRFLIKSRGVATITPSAGNQVLGVLWHVTPTHLETLDRYEGVRGGFYARSEVAVRTETRTVSALVYIAADATEGRPRPGYLKRLVAGAHLHGLPTKYIEQTLSAYAIPGPRSAPET